MDTNLLLAGGLFAGLIAATWSRLKNLLTRITSAAVVTVRLEDKALRAVSGYLWRRFKRSPYGSRRFLAISEFVRPRGRQEYVACEGVPPSGVVFWNGWYPIWLSVKAGSEGVSVYDVGEITFLRGTFDAEALIVAAMAEFNAPKAIDRVDGEKRYKVERMSGTRGLGGVSFGAAAPGSSALNTEPREPGLGDRPDLRPVGIKREDLGQPVTAGSLSRLALPPEAERLVDGVRKWLDAKTWYEERNIPWRMGALLGGPPGCGKTSLARALAQTFDLPLFVFDLSTFGNRDFHSAWERLLSQAPCVALFEDFDAVFKGRTNVTADEHSPGVTFDCILNALSGVQDSSGVLTLVTTNRPETLDPAMGAETGDGRSTRPGRLDYSIHMGSPSETGRELIAKRILAGFESHIAQTVRDGEDETGAQFEARCAALALKLYWEREGAHGPADRAV